MSEVYAIDIEYPIGGGWAYSRWLETTENKAWNLTKKMKKLGVGGRLLFLDGSPNGQIVDHWSSPARLGT